jgi:hypothetical protein
MQNILIDKKIAVIGNAQSLFEKSYGELIDSHDLVCRINLGIQVNSPTSHGVKKDVLVVSTENMLQDCLKYLGNIKHIFIGSLKDRTYRNDLFYFPEDIHLKIRRDIFQNEKARPTTGFIFLNYLKFLNLTNVSIFGFDWKETPTFYDTLRKHEPHDYDIEKNYCLNYLKDTLGFKFYL